MVKPEETDKKGENEFKLKSLMLDLDEYLKVHILPQIPAEYKEFRDSTRNAMDAAWHAMYRAAVTSDRERQRNLINLKVEFACVETYIREVRDICYRGKRKLDKNSERRFSVLAKKQRAVSGFVWTWARNVDNRIKEDRENKKTSKHNKVVKKD